MNASCGARVALRRVHELGRPVAIVRPGEDDVDGGQLAGHGQQVLDSLSGGDASHVENELRVCGKAEPLAQVGSSRRRSSGAGKPLPRTRIFSAPTSAQAATASPSRSRCDDHSRSAADDPAVERRVERALQQHLAQARLEHAERLEDVGHALEAAPGRDAGRDRIAEPEDVNDVRPLGAGQLDRQRGGDAHPAVAERRREVAHVCAVDDSGRAAKAGTRLEIDDRRRQDVDRVPPRDETAHELTGGDDGPSEGARRRPDGCGEEDPQGPIAHGYYPC